MQSLTTFVSRVHDRLTRAVERGALAVLTLLAATAALVGCSTWSPTPEARCLDETAYVAYYYKYKEASPDQSDLVYIEFVPLGGRCFRTSAKTAPVFPGAAVTPYVKNGSMKIQAIDGQVVDINGMADIAVYYDRKAQAGSADPKAPLAVEDLRGVSRLIQTLSVTVDSPGCGACPSVKCDVYYCCKPPPCP